MTYLLTALHNNTLKDEVRHMAAVILRRLFASEFQEFYTAVSDKRFDIHCLSILTNCVVTALFGRFIELIYVCGFLFSLQFLLLI